jgi:hypothetical protein
MTDHVLVASGRALIAHCPYRLGLSEGWARDPNAGWRVVRRPCEACEALAATLGIEVEPPSQVAPSAVSGAP